MTVKSYLPPANEVCEGYVFTPVCQSFCSQEGVCLSACWDSRPPPGADTSPCTVHAGKYGQQAGGTHPTGMYTCFEVSFKKQGQVTLDFTQNWDKIPGLLAAEPPNTKSLAFVQCEWIVVPW